MQKPSKRYPSSAGSFGALTPADLPDPSINADAYNDLIANRGILFTHTKALPCPNVQDVESMIHVSDCDHPDCWNGYLQVDPKRVWGYFNNDQLNKLFEIQGEYNENLAVITLSSVNTDGSECDTHPFDQLVADEYTKRVYELVETSPIGIDRLKYFALDVAYLTSGDGRVFKLGVDYILDSGKIKWMGTNRPGYNQALQRGDVYSITYYVRPIFYVHHIMKELRASQVFDPCTGEKVAVRLPQHILALRELLVPDEQDKVGDSTAKSPRKGILRPR